MRVRGLVVSAAVGVVTPAAATPVDLDNSKPTPIIGLPFVKIRVDDFGAYGNLLGNTDSYLPDTDTVAKEATRFAGAYVFFTSTDPSGVQHSAKIALTTNPAWIALIGGNNIVSTFPDLKMTVTPNGVVGNNTLTSEILFVDATTQTELALTINQKLIGDIKTRTTSLVQEYVFENRSIPDASQTPMDLVFHVQWDPNILWDDDLGNDIVGRRGGCYVYARDDRFDQAFSLEEGLNSTERARHFFAGKAGFDPGGNTPYNGTDDQVFANAGLPGPWIDNIANVPNGTFGESGTFPGDANLGLEWRPQIAIQGKQHLFVIRTYGTAIRTCPPGTQCGDPADDPEEECQSSQVDSPTCDFTCLFPRCGDGHVNTMAGETCESSGIDTTWCNGAGGQAAGNCSIDPFCGDGYANSAIGEPCDSGMVDDATCNGALAVKNDGSNESVACTPVTCGDHYTNMEAGEECDTGGFDTGECNGGRPGMAASCKRTRCGDGYLNELAVELGGPGEVCDEGGETATCNGPNAITFGGDDVSCKPAMCGDGYANAANAEECDGDDLCDETCTYSFQLGGGCGGCASKNPEAGWILGVGVGVFVLRRRRYNSRRST